MVYFRNRIDAGRQLCPLLKQYKNQDVVVYALPRGGVTVAAQIATFLHAPLDLILAHKIGHPYQPEYAIAAVSESGHIVGNPKELESVNEQWLEYEKQRQIEDIQRRRKFYLKGRKDIPVEGKVALIVDDGIATGQTMKAGIRELKDRNPSKIVVVVPVAPRRTADILKTMADDVIAVDIPEDYDFLGAIGAYYEDFDQVEDDEVKQILDHFNKN